MGKTFDIMFPLGSAAISGDAEKADPFGLLGVKGPKEALRLQQEQNALDRKLRAEATERSRQDLARIFPAAQGNLLAGNQAAMGMLAQGVPQQASLLSGGNMAAQQALLAGLPQIQNAILGLPTDMSGLQATQLQFDPSFLQQQMPNFTIPDVMPPAPQPAPQPAPVATGSPLGGFAGDHRRTR